MTPLEDPGVRALLLDVEGTTTPEAFVHEVLFPFARAEVAGFLERHRGSEAVGGDLARLREEHAADLAGGLAPPAWEPGPPAADPAAAVAYVHWLMDRDRKSTGLKALQGKVWEEGYREGRLEGEVFSDVPPAFERWRRQGREIAIFSSGSVLAQRLLFSSTPSGDLTRFIRAHFDTTMGPKTEPGSYRRIAGALGFARGEILFLTDAVPELDAAREAGLGVALCARGAASAGPPAVPVVSSFDAVCP